MPGYRSALLTFDDNVHFADSSDSRFPLSKCSDPGTEKVSLSFFFFDWTVPPTEFAITLNARSLRRRKICENCRGKSPKRERKKSTHGTQLVVGFVEGVDALVSHSVHAIEPVLVSADRSVTLKTEAQGFNFRRHASFMCFHSHRRYRWS